MNNDLAELTQLAHQVLAVRAAQKLYFRIRSDEHLASAKELERKLDKRCEEIINPQSSLGL